ncbi:S1 family peptidase [Pedococcus bigeumensis]|uniref:S1 family peptidase n=1 Tax=Pedococcus bigeumensis TaxID=433644 RepID=UPI002FEC0727
MLFSPMHATGVMFGLAHDDVVRFMGTCFLYGEDDLVATAKHCVAPEGLLVRFPLAGEERKVVEVHRHPTADLALLRLDRTLRDVTDLPTGRTGEARPRYAFWGQSAVAGIGSPIQAFGYPGPATPIGTAPQEPRLFRGYVQSFHRAGDFGRHQVHEVSFPGPPGLSGGAVYRMDIPDLVMGVVTGHVDGADGKNYGLFLGLEEVAPWLNGIVPPPGLPS